MLCSLLNLPESSRCWLAGFICFPLGIKGLVELTGNDELAKKNLSSRMGREKTLMRLPEPLGLAGFLVSQSTNHPVTPCTYHSPERPDGWIV